MKAARPIPIGRTAARFRLPHPVISFGLGLGSLGVAQVLSPSTTATIAGTIQQVEGYYPGSLAYINNNPGNLIFAGQAGATMGAGGFAKFQTYQDGVNALDDQIQLYAGRGLTISDMMAIYAPASAGNDPTSYANKVASALGVSPDTSLISIDGLAANPSTDFSGLLPDLSGVTSWLSSLDSMTLTVGSLALFGLVLFAARD